MNLSLTRLLVYVYVRSSMFHMCIESRRVAIYRAPIVDVYKVDKFIVKEVVSL